MTGFRSVMETEREALSMGEVLNDRYEDGRNVSLLACDQYDREVNWIETEPLSPEEEKKYLDRIFRARSDPSSRWLQDLAKDARERLVEHYQPVIRNVVQKYARWFRGLDFLDLVQEANIALLHAFNVCDPEEMRGPFLAWVLGCVRVALVRSYWDEKGFVRICCRIQKEIADITSVEERFRQELGRFPKDSELCDELGLSHSRLYELLHYRCLLSFESVEAVCERDVRLEECSDFSEMYPSVSGVEAARSLFLAQCVELAVSRLSPRQREVVQLRYGLGGESVSTNEEASVLLGMTRVNTNGLVHHARNRLRVLLAPLYEGQEVVA